MALIAIVILASFEVDTAGGGGCIIFVLWLAVGFGGGDALGGVMRSVVEHVIDNTLDNKLSKTTLCRLIP